MRVIFNDRLLLGLKGTMSEAELHILKARMLEGRRAKARRGELGKAIPKGYLRRLSGEVVLGPDEQVQATIRLVFELSDRFRTIGKVMRYLVDHNIRMPVRLRGGAHKGELEWRSGNRASLHNLLANPTYAGVYVYGRHPSDPRRHKPGRASHSTCARPANVSTIAEPAATSGCSSMGRTTKPLCSVLIPANPPIRPACAITQLPDLGLMTGGGPPMMAYKMGGSPATHSIAIYLSPSVMRRNRRSIPA